MIVWIVIWIKNLLYHLRLHARSVLYISDHSVQPKKSYSVLQKALVCSSQHYSSVLPCAAKYSFRTATPWNRADYASAGPMPKAIPSDTPSDAQTCRMWPQAHEQHKQTQVLRTAARTATTCDSKFWMMLKSLPNCRTSQSATTCDSSYAPNSTQYYSVLQGTTPVLQSTTPPHEKDCECSCIQHNSTIPPNP